MNTCLICQSKISPFLSFGKMPLANGFLNPSDFSSEYFFNLTVCFCNTCNMVQLGELVDRNKMFHENYAFYSSTSAFMSEHFKNASETIITDYLNNVTDPFVIEIGSNDGIFLKHFSGRKIRHLGIEPSKNVARVAKNNGINTLSEFFDEKLSKQIVKKYGKAHIIFSANVMCHIPYMHSVIDGIKQTLAPNGLFIFEDPYLGDIVEKTSYDQIYDEHAFYFSVSSISYLMGMHDLEVVNVQRQNVHGGSMRYYIAHKNAMTVSPSVINMVAYEKKKRLDELSTFEDFKSRVNESKKQLVRLLIKLKDRGEEVIGYGATSKSTTILNYCNISPKLLSYICDTTPIKINKYSPGMHIPIRSYKEFSKSTIKHVLLFAWNHKEEILLKEKNFLANGGKFITYVPTVSFLLK